MSSDDSYHSYYHLIRLQPPDSSHTAISSYTLPVRINKVMSPPNIPFRVIISRSCDINRFADHPIYKTVANMCVGIDPGVGGIFDCGCPATSGMILKCPLTRRPPPDDTCQVTGNLDRTNSYTYGISTQLPKCKVLAGEKPDYNFGTTFTNRVYLYEGLDD